jgi:hypothetical protein
MWKLEHFIEKLNKQYRGKQKLQNEKLENSQEKRKIRDFARKRSRSGNEQQLSLKKFIWYARDKILLN